MSERGKFKERIEREGDRGPATPEVQAHGSSSADGREQPAPLVEDELIAQAAGEGDAESDEPETEGHLMTHPYMMEKAAQNRQQELLSDADRFRQADQAAPKSGGLRDRLRRRSNDE